MGNQLGESEESTVFGGRRLGYESQFYHLLVWWPGANHIISLSLT